MLTRMICVTTRVRVLFVLCRELDYNQLTRLRFGVFNGLNNLEKLILSNNMISTIDVGTFDALVDLKVL